MSAISYRPDIDGLRAVAVLPVILFHCDERILPGGFLGVDVFFVISGFLITSIMLRELADGTFSLKQFWARRIRRILPNLLIVSIATMAVTWVFVFKGDHTAIARQVTAALFSFANIYFLYGAGNYWGQEALHAPFLHTWSLSVEEQFYLLLPPLTKAIHRLARPALIWVLLTLVVASLGLFIYGMRHHPIATFYLLPTRAWEIGAGAVLACVMDSPRFRFPHRYLANALVVIGLATIGWAYLVSSSLSLNSLLVVVGSCFVIAAGGGAVAKLLLENVAAVGIGKLSYGLYIWHWPILVFGEEIGVGSQKLLLVAITFIAAALTFFMLENPARKMAHAVPRIGAAFACTAATAGLMATFPTFYDTRGFTQPESYCLYYDTNPHSCTTSVLPQIFRGVKTPRRPDAFPEDYVTGGVRAGPKDGPPLVVLIGDSQGTVWSHAVAESAGQRGLPTALWSMNGVSPFTLVPIPADADRKNAILSDAERRRYDQARLDMIDKWRPKLVVVAALWSQIREPEADSTLGYLCARADHVLIIEQPPVACRRGRSMLQYLGYLGICPDGADEKCVTLALADAKAYEKGRELMRRVASQHANCTVLPIADVFMHDDRVLVLRGRELLYFDATHLTEAGVGLCLRRFSDAIDRIMLEEPGIR